MRDRQAATLKAQAAHQQYGFDQALERFVDFAAACQRQAFFSVRAQHLVALAGQGHAG
ncbi:hypothetical protein D3C71_2173570 [compost metagenome]